MIQICQKDKEKVCEAIRTGKIDAAEIDMTESSSKSGGFRTFKINQIDDNK